MSYYREPDIHIKDKVKVLLDLPIYPTKKNRNMQQVLINLI